MKATFDGTTVLDIQYSDKEIKRCFNSYTREMEWDCYWHGKFVGTATSNQDAHSKLDALAYAELTRVAA